MAPPVFAGGLVRELKREVGSKHPLHAKSATALAVAKDRDDVLFEIADNVSRKYAVVHLGWTGRFENSAVWPRTVFFDTLQQWLDWMKADHEDCTFGEDADK